MVWTRRLVVITTALTLALSGTAIAAPPQTTRTFDITGSTFWTSCPGFDIRVDYSFDVADTLFFDQSGSVTREQLHFRGTGTLVNTVTGKTNTGSSPTMDVYDYKRGTFTEVGLTFHNTMPGAGIVALTAGKIVFALDADGQPTGDPLFVAGPHPGFDNIDWCSLVS
jgi:hypothetical protein